MTPIPFYLSPQLARENLIASRMLNGVRRAERDQAKRQAAEFTEALEQLKRLGWDDENARAMAQIKAYGVQS